MSSTPYDHYYFQQDMIELKETVYILKNTFCIPVVSVGTNYEGVYHLTFTNHNQKELIQLSKCIQAFNDLILNETVLKLLIIPTANGTVIYCRLIMDQCALNQFCVFVTALFVYTKKREYGY
eukprot:TRINITY_DN10375_c0_g1_i1.p1 TRINITY_DN10375_c0_g1~~TRINITY_DN10375_c0_g1_i1.p1  ORF type:complete len:122 (+),score=14.60 TRINITY_DN10375_c0_g1_i1:54-419(+)